MAVTGRFILRFASGPVIVREFDEIWATPDPSTALRLPGEESGLRASDEVGNIGRIVQVIPPVKNQGTIRASGVLVWSPSRPWPWTTPVDIKNIIQGYDTTAAWHALDKYFVDLYGNEWRVEPLRFDADFADLSGAALEFEAEFAVLSGPVLMRGPCSP